MTCSTKVPITDAHRQEALKAAGKDPKAQDEYLKTEAATGCATGCKCKHGVVGSSLDDNTVYASCNSDPSQIQDKDKDKDVNVI